jgi:hypothetical protein
MQQTLDTLDYVRVTSNIIDAHQRDDGLIEAVTQDEELKIFHQKMKSGKLVEVTNMLTTGSIKPEMYKLHKKLKVWFHSNKTLKRYKKNNGEEE